MRKIEAPEEYDPKDYSCYECDNCALKKRLSKDNTITKYFFCNSFRQELKSFKSCEDFELRTKEEPYWSDPVASFLFIGSAVSLFLGFVFLFKHHLALAISFFSGAVILFVSFQYLLYNTEEYIATLNPNLFIPSSSNPEHAGSKSHALGSKGKGGLL